MSNAHAYPHEHTGVETRKLGMWVFLSTEILFFGTLITTFMIFKGRPFQELNYLMFMIYLSPRLAHLYYL